MWLFLTVLLLIGCTHKQKVMVPLLWTDSSAAKRSIAAISLNRNGPVGISVNDPEAKYGNLIRELVYNCTNDFFPYYVYQEVHE